MAGVKIKRFCHPAIDALQGKPAQMTGRDLDGEGNIFEIGANPLDQDEIIPGRLKPSIGQPASFHEQADGGGRSGAVLRTGIQRGDLIEGLALHPKRAPAGVGQDHRAAGRTQFSDRVGDRIEHVLAIVHQQHGAGVVQTLEHLDAPFDAGQGRNQQGRRYRGPDLAAPLKRRQINQPCALREGGFQRPCELYRQPRLANSAGTDERYQPRRVGHLDQLFQLAFAPEE
jgi:hypothetical protein